MNKDVSSRLARAQQLTAEIDRLIEVYTTPDFTMLDVATILYNYLGMQLRMMDDPDGLESLTERFMLQMSQVLRFAQETSVSPKQYFAETMVH